MTKVEFLSFIVNVDSVKIDLSKVKVIEDWSILKSYYTI